VKEFFVSAYPRGGSRKDKRKKLVGRNRKITEKRELVGEDGLADG
jgi:hypothetical protein